MLHLVGKSRDPEVRDAHAASPVDHHVGGLEVAVQDPLVVGGGDPRAELAAHLHRLVRWKAADATQQRREVLAVHVLHGDEVLALGLADVVGPTDVGVGDLTGNTHLVMKPAQPHGVVGGTLRQKLEGDRLAQLQVVGTVHLAHAAAAETAHDAISLGEQGAGREAAVVDRAGVAGVGERRTHRGDRPLPGSLRSGRVVVGRPHAHRFRIAAEHPPGHAFPCPRSRRARQ